MKQTKKQIISLLIALGIVFCFTLAFSLYPVFAAYPTTKYAPGETTDPACSPGDSNCDVFAPLTSTSTLGLNTGDISEGINLYFTTARGRDVLSSSVTGIDYATSTGIFSLGAGYIIPLAASTTNWNNSYNTVAVSSTYWDATYSWGNHATAGYLTTSTNLTTANFATGTISQWINDSGYITDGNTGWDNSYGFITTYSESDPIWLAASTSYAKLSLSNTFAGTTNTFSNLVASTFSNGTSTIYDFAPLGVNLVFEGDSITLGSNLPAGNDWPTRFKALNWANGRYNLSATPAVAGSELTDLVSRYNSAVLPYAPVTTGNPAYLFVLVGANDIVDISSSADYFSSLSSYWQNAKDDGFTLVAGTIMPFVSEYGTPTDIIRKEINYSIRNSDIPDYVVDFSSIITNPNDTAVLPDGLHPATNTYKMMAKMVNTVLQTGSGVMSNPYSTVPSLTIQAGAGETTSSTPLLRLTNNANTANYLYVDGTGSVMIGGDRPRKKFDVDGGIFSAETIASFTGRAGDELLNNIQVGAYVDSSGNSAVLGHHSKSGVYAGRYGYLELYGGTRAITWDYYGNVGIKSVWASSSLAVGGNVSIGSGFTTTSAPTNGLIVQGDVGFGTNTSTGKALEINSATGAVLRLTYNDSDGSATNYTDLSVGSDGALTISPANSATTTIANGLVVNTNSLVVNKANGRVGVGTTNPSQTLDVNGSIIASASGASITAGLGNKLVLAGDSGATGEIPAGALASSNQGGFSMVAGSVVPNSAKLGGYYFSTGNGWLSAFEVSNVASGYSNLLLMKSGGKVGIGTAAPSTTLHLLSTTEQLRLGYNAANYTSFTVGSNGALTIGTTNSATTTITNGLAVSGQTTLTTTTVSSGNLIISSAANNNGIDGETKLMLHMDGTNGSTTFTDSSSGGNTVTASGNAQISTASSTFGGASGLFDGSGDYVSVPDSNDWNFSSGNFTVDAWVNWSVLPTSGNYQTLFGQRTNGTSNHSLSVALNNNSGAYRWYVGYTYNGTSEVIWLSDWTTPSVNTWYHVALVRNGGNLLLYINGSLLGSTNIGSNSLYDSTATFKVGSTDSSYYWNGYIDEFRVTKGLARWTSNFTPPTGAYSTSALSSSGGAIGIGTTTPQYPIHLSSGAYVSFGGVWTNASDRNLKENFTTVTSTDILDKINQLVITQWNYKSESASTTHIGPVAQDFYALFGLGGSDTSISTIDPAGVALLGIQALSQKLDILSSSTLSFGVPSFYTNNITIEKKMVLGEDTIGQAVILSGATSTLVTFSESYQFQPIITVTPIDYDGAWKLMGISTTSFRVSVSEPLQTTTTFNWHSFSSNEQTKIFSSDGSINLVNVLVLPSEGLVSNDQLQVESVGGETGNGGDTTPDSESTTSTPNNDSQTTTSTDSQTPTTTETTSPPAETPVSPVVGSPLAPETPVAPVVEPPSTPEVPPASVVEVPVMPSVEIPVLPAEPTPSPPVESPPPVTTE